MRCLNTKTYERVEEADSFFREGSGYATISYRCGLGRLNFRDYSRAYMVSDVANDNPLAVMILNACAILRDEPRPIHWLWIDTCCIDRSNPTDLSRSIQSMFKWYNNATVCYVYLWDVVFSRPSDDMFCTHQSIQSGQREVSEWFTRGWTLQELLAPRHLIFFDREWTKMGTKKDLAKFVRQATGIDEKYITGEAPLREASVAARMSWMAGRKTSEPEDIAYSMLGIFNVSIVPNYSEGERAFMRLQEELLQRSDDESLFAWSLTDTNFTCFPDLQMPRSTQTWGLLAPSPDCFKHSKDILVIPEKVVPRPRGGYRWTQQGVMFEIPAKAPSEFTNLFGIAKKKVDFPLNCWRRDATGQPETIVLRLSKAGDSYVRESVDRLDQKRGAKPSSNSVLGIDQQLTRSLVVKQPAYP